MRGGLPAAQFELLDNVANLLKAVYVSMLPSNGVGNDEKCCSLKEKHLISIKDAGEVAQATLQLSDVGNQQVHNVGPCLSEGKGKGGGGGDNSVLSLSSHDILYSLPYRVFHPKWMF